MQQLTDNVWVFPGGTNIGIVRMNEHRVVPFDTGLNDSLARKVLRFVRDELDSEVAAILTTHGHADHFGANAFVVKRTGAAVYAPEIDEVILRHPLMQPVFLYGGADPLTSLRNRFLLAEAGPVDHVIKPGMKTIGGIDIEVISLPGHSMNQVGYLVDGVFFCADVVFPDAAIEKYRIPYLFGLTAHLASLDVAREVACERVVPGHGPIEGSIERLVDVNRAAISRTIGAVLDATASPQTGDQITACVFRTLDVPIDSPQAYYLLRPTIAAYLSHLDRVGEIETMVERGEVLFRGR